MASAAVLDWTTWLESGQWRGGVQAAVPMLPALANQVMHLVMDPEVSAHRITTVVAKDPVLATRVVRLANTAFSAPAIEINTINEAVVRIGTRAVRNAVLAECLASRLLDPKIYGAHGNALIDHSIGTAYLAWLLAEAAGESPDEAFLYGLLHDIGKLLVLKLAHDFRRQFPGQPNDEELSASLVTHHAALGGDLCQAWGLPHSLHDPIVWHHEPDRAEQAPGAATLAYAANRLAHRYGFGCDKDDFAPLDDPIVVSIGLDDRTLAQTDSHAPGLFQVARQIIR